MRASRFFRRFSLMAQRMYVSSKENRVSIISFPSSRRTATATLQQ